MYNNVVLFLGSMLILPKAMFSVVKVPEVHTIGADLSTLSMRIVKEASIVLGSLITA